MQQIRICKIHGAAFTIDDAACDVLDDEQMPCEKEVFLLVPIDGGGGDIQAAADVFVAKAAEWEEQVHDFPFVVGRESASEMVDAVVSAWLGEQP